MHIQNIAHVAFAAFMSHVVASADLACLQKGLSEATETYSMFLVEDFKGAFRVNRSI
jgi:hypothetical protein